jgi:uncharacterized metal-binding protein YceD (DUF177 family)
LGWDKKQIMGHRRDFEIAFVGLKPGIHEYNYEITDRFFDNLASSASRSSGDVKHEVQRFEQEFRQCNAKVKLLLEKNNSFMLLKFEIGGTLEVTCDRCNSNLPLELWDEFKMTVKIVEDPELMNDQEEDPDVYYIGRSESHIDVTNWIYEFINLSIPMQKSCEFEKMNGPHCNPSALDVLKKMKPEDNTKKENPIWKGLEKFKGLE